MDDSDPLWGSILRRLYEDGPVEGSGTWAADESFDEIVETIAAETGHDEDAVEETMQEMAGWDLLNEDGQQYASGSVWRAVSLTETGFQVAHQRELAAQERRLSRLRDRRQHRVNRGLAFLTLGLVFVGAIQSTVTALVGASAPLWQVNGALATGVLVVAAIAAALWRADMLAAWEAG